MIHFSKIAGLSLMLTLGVMAGCNTKNDKPAPKEAETEKAADTSLKLAYVDVDSLMKQYDFCIDYGKILQKKTETIQRTLDSKGLSLQKDIADFQSKMEQGAYTREQAESAQTALQKKQMQLQNLQQSLATEFDKEQNSFNDALRDSIHNFLASYNKSFGYNLIMSKAGDNILLADKHLDITDDVVKGLNKRYKRPESIQKALQKK